MKTFYSFFFVMVAAIISNYSFAQTNKFPSTGAAGIGTTSPEASSLLEVKSTSKGVLIPRMTQVQRNAITSTANGLLIYQTNATPGFYYYDGTVSAWQLISNSVSGANASLSNLATTTKVNVNLLPDSNNKRNFGSVTKGWKNLYLDGAVYLGGSRFLSHNTGTGIHNTAVGDLSLISSTTGFANTANGYNALYSNTAGYDNTANGAVALYSNTIGFDNTANGSNALYANTEGYYNTANGSNALYANTTGTYNTANGYRALYSNTTGFVNTANGEDALAFNTTGYYNTANGVQALVYNTTGSDNTAAGIAALGHNRTGSYNSGFGESALYQTTASQYNTAVGYHAGYSYDNGYNNVFLGANTDVNNGNGYYNVVAIGEGTICTDVSQVTIGNGATATYRAYANWSNISDGRFKKNIKENVPGLAFINKLQPITYTLDATGIDNFLHQSQPQDKQISGQGKVLMSKALAAKEKTICTGFVAQDVEKAAKSLNYDFSGVDAAKNDKDLYGLRYAEFVVPLVKGMQELSKMNDEKDAKINDLETRLAKLEAMMNVQQSTANNKLQTTSISSASLEQNIPNPFQNSTAISYNLPQQYSSAKIIITDKSGKVLKQIAVSGNGKGSVQVNTSTLSSGAYQYSLYVDEKMIDSKQMVLAK